MCGRYTLTSQDDLVGDLQLAIGEPVDPRVPSSPPGEWWRPRFNVAPTQPAPVIPNRAGPRHLEMMRWGLVPVWAKSLADSARRINARVETAATSPAFRDALRRRRCLVVADGFYEWRKDGKRRVPFYLRPVPRQVITFAGLWERWKGPDGVWIPSFAILTGAPNGLVAPLHDRMPLVIAPDDRDRWLAPDDIDPVALEDLLAPWAPDGWKASEVSPHVNRPDNDDPACIEPVAEA